MGDILDMSNILDIDLRIDEYLERVFRISKSYSTKRSYKGALNKFQRFLSKENTDLSSLLKDLNEKKKDPIIILDSFYTYLSKENASKSTIAGYLCVTKDFLNFHGMHIYNEDVKRRFRTPKREVFYEEGLTKAKINRLLHSSPPKLQVAILLTCSSGLRIGEMVQLKLSDIDFSTTPTTIRARRETTKTRETRFTHITSEATKVLNDYLERTLPKTSQHTGDPYLFLNYQGEEGSHDYHKAVISTRGTFMNMLRELATSIPELSTRNENGQYNIHFHAFRKYFRTTVGNVCGRDFAEELMGHGFYMDTYYQLSVEKRREMYLKAEPHLTVSDFKAVEKDMKVLSTKYQNLENKVDDLMAYLRTNSIEVPDFLRT